MMKDPSATILEKETQFFRLLTKFIQRYAENPPATIRLGQEKKAVTVVREYIRNNFSSDITLKDLSRAANFSGYYLIRVFKRQVGLSPHAYLIQTRIRRARALLACGYPIAQTAHETGFADQSHLTRHFKRFYGYTSGRYRKMKRARLFPINTGIHRRNMLHY